MIAKPPLPWDAVARMIPTGFDAWNNSSPGRPFWRLVYWKRETRKQLDRVAFVHDWGYWYGRLPGAPLGTHQWSRADWDRCFYWYLRDQGIRYPALIEYRGLRFGGGRAWRKNARTMERMGDTHFTAYLSRKMSEKALGSLA